MQVSIVYDGQCPVCSRLAAASRLRERAAAQELIDARSVPVDDVQGNDLGDVDFNQGFAVVVNGEVHLGADGARMLALLTEPTGIFFRLFQLLVRGSRRSRFFYPLLRAGRNLLLRMMGVPQITHRSGNGGR